MADGISGLGSEFINEAKVQIVGPKKPQAPGGDDSQVKQLAKLPLDALRELAGVAAPGLLPEPTESSPTLAANQQMLRNQEQAKIKATQARQQTEQAYQERTAPKAASMAALSGLGNGGHSSLDQGMQTVIASKRAETKNKSKE